MPKPPPLVLASTSEFRRRSLQRLRLAFETAAPQVGEDAQPGEAPRELACRLARAKAGALAAKRPEAAVIGADQVLEVHGKSFGKPMGAKAAISQLRQLSGRSGVFHSAVCVLHLGQQWQFCVPTEATWLKLSPRQIEEYVAAEPSLHSAGAAQLENYGICLLDRLSSDDPSAVLGLPLIKLCAVLRELGFVLPAAAAADNA